MADPAGYHRGGVTVRNLGAFRRGLRRLDRGLDLELGRYIREFAKPILADARRRTPIGRPDRRAAGQRKAGGLAKSIKLSVKQKQATLYSNQPDAPVHEFGGTIHPRGRPIHIKEVAMLRGAVAEKSDEVEAHMMAMFDSLANRI